MNKLFKRFFYFVFATALFLTLGAGVNAADVITFKTSKVMDNYNCLNIYDQTCHFIPNAGTTYKTAVLADKTTVMAYCFNHALEAPPENSTLSLRNLTAYESANINSFIYILENGWNGSSWKRSGSFTNEEKYYITQLTIWALQGTAQGGVNLDTLYSGCWNNVQKNMITAAKSFLADAKAHNTQSPTTISIAPKDSTMKLSSDGKYYETGEFTVSGKGYSTYSITLSGAPTGTVIYNTTGKAVVKSGSSVKAGSKFKVRIPSGSSAKAANFAVKVAATGVYKNLKIYRYNTTVQDIGVPVETKKAVNAAASIKYAPTGSLKVTKVSVNAAGTESALKGAIIVVKNSAGTKIAEWNTKDVNPKTISNLAFGTYTIEETYAPTGYAKATTVKVSINSTKTHEVKLVNVKDRQPIYISKQDITSKTELAGAKLVVKDSKGKEVESWTSTNSPHLISKKLDPGTYTLTETMAPEGYQKSTETVKFTVNSNGGVDTPVVMYNTPKKDVYISKQDATTGKELPGAHLVLKNSLGGVVEEWTSGTTPHIVSKKLSPGKYTLSETIAPEGYQAITETVTFTVNEQGGVDTPVVMKNKPNSSVKISKQDITTGKELPGATLTVKNEKGDVIDEWVSTTTPHYLPANLPAGKYTLIEKKSPEGYGLSEEVITFEIKDGEVDKTVTMTNSPIPVTADIPMAKIIAGIALAAVCGVAVFYKIGKQNSEA